MIVVPAGFIKIALTKLVHIKHFSGPFVSMISPSAELSLDRGGELSIGRNFKMRDHAKLRVRASGRCIIGDNTSINSNSMVVCHNRIVIGNNVQLSPNVQIYDHDHDYSVPGGVQSMRYRLGDVEIGDNVWIGANSVILKDTRIGNNCVIGAGSIIHGVYDDNSVIVQKRETHIKKYNI